MNTRISEERLLHIAADANDCSTDHSDPRPDELVAELVAEIRRYRAMLLDLAEFGGYDADGMCFNCGEPQGDSEPPEPGQVELAQALEAEFEALRAERPKAPRP